MDEGWTRWMLERYGFEALASIREISGAARSAIGFDALVIADEGRGLLDGYAPASCAQDQGGIGTDGVRAIDAFVQAGGTLVCFNRSTAFAIRHFGLPVTNVVGGLKRQEFFTGGSVLEVAATTTHPVMAGMPDRAAIFVDDSPAFETGEGFTGEVLARYQDTGSPLLSGYLLGERFLNHRAAALDVARGHGHIILLGFRPQWRGQSRHVPSGLQRGDRGASHRGSAR